MLAGLAVGVLASSGLAQNRVTVSHPGDAWRDPGFNGGAFRATHVQGYIGEFGGPGSVGSSFLTFCLERDEFVSLGGTYHADLDIVAREGGVGGPSPDPISPETAALYQEFRNGGTFGGLIGAIDAAATRSIQLAIWFLEDENPGSAYTNDAVANGLVAWANANDDGTIGRVRVMNLWANGDGMGNQQDMLTIVPLPPAAWAGIGSLAGVALIGVVRRRKQLN
jgi:hypothetical protein